MRLQIAAKPSVICCHLANTNEELGGLATTIPLFAKLLRSLLRLKEADCEYRDADSVRDVSCTRFTNIVFHFSFYYVMNNHDKRVK